MCANFYRLVKVLPYFACPAFLSQTILALLTLQSFSSQSIFGGLFANFHIIFRKLPKGWVISSWGKLHANASESFALGKDENKTCCLSDLPLSPSFEGYFWCLLWCLVSPHGSCWSRTCPDPCSNMGTEKLQIRPLVFSTTLLGFPPSHCSCSWMHPRDVLASQWLHPAKGLSLQQTELRSALRSLWRQSWPKQCQHHPKSDWIRNSGHPENSPSTQV